MTGNPDVRALSVTRLRGACNMSRRSCVSNVHAITSLYVLTIRRSTGALVFLDDDALSCVRTVSRATRDAASAWLMCVRFAIYDGDTNSGSDSDRDDDGDETGFRVHVEFEHVEEDDENTDEDDENTDDDVSDRLDGCVGLLPVWSEIQQSSRA